MKVIQVFSETEIDHRRLSSFVLSHFQAKEFYPSVVLWTSKAGKALLCDELKLEYDEVHLLPDIGTYLSSFYVAAEQTEPFAIISGSVFLRKPCLSHILTHSHVVLSSTGLSAADYIHATDVENVTGLSVYDKGNDVNVFGGNDPIAWCDYFEYIQKFLRCSTEWRVLSKESVSFLLNTSLLNTFIRSRRETLFYLMEPFRIPTLKSASELWRIHHGRDLVALPRHLYNHPETEQFIYEQVKYHYPAVYERLKTLASAAGSDRWMKYFPFTSMIARKNNLFDPSLIDSYELFSKKVSGNMISRSTATDLLQDAFSYEEGKYNWKCHIRDVTDGIGVTTERATTDRLVVGDIVILDTKWNWRIGLQLEELVELKYLDNYITPAGSFSTLCTFDEHNNIREYDIDELSYILLDLFSEPNRIEEVIRKASVYFDDDDTQSNDEKVKAIIHQRIVSLYRWRALRGV